MLSHGIDWKEIKAGGGWWRQQQAQPSNVSVKNNGRQLWSVLVDLHELMLPELKWCLIMLVYWCNVCVYLHSWMYWTDWEEDEVNDSIGRIEKAWMDGSNRRIFVTSNMLWPNGLTLDHSTSTMYWCDAYYDHIERIHLNGTGRMVSVNICTEWLNDIHVNHFICDLDLRVNNLVRWWNSRPQPNEQSGLNTFYFSQFICGIFFVSMQHRKHNKMQLL